MLRTTLVLAGLLALLPASPARLTAGPREDALAVIEKAIKAHGGEKGLLKVQSCTRKGEGVMLGGNKEQPFNDVLAITLPDRLRHVVDFDQKARIVTVLNGDQGWTLSGGQVTMMSKEFRDEITEEVYVWSLTTLVPLTQGAYNLALLPETRVDDRPAVGVRVRAKGRPEVRLYFDKESQLLIKIARPARFAGAVIEKEYLFRTFREFDGVKLPTQAVETIAGRKFSELKRATYDLSKPDDSQFQRP